MVWYPDCLIENKKDYGYTIIIVIASFMCRCVIFSMVYASGIYYVAILDDLKTSKALSAWVGSLLIANVSMASIVSSALHNRYGPRATTSFSAVIASFGLISSVFATNIYYLFLSYGVITGVGIGIALVPTIVCVSDYTDKFTHIAQSIASSGSSMGIFIGPLLVERLISYYGWRGSVLISSAIVLNLGAFGLLFRPFKDNERRPLICVQRSVLSVQVMNWNIFKHKGFIMVCLINTCVSFSNSIILIHLPAYSQWDVGVSTQNAAMLLSLVGGMGIGARLLYGFAISNKCPPYLIVAVCSLGFSISAGILPSITSLAGLVVYSTFTGAFISSNGGAVWPAILTDLLGEGNLSNSVGVLNFLSAMGNLAGPPIAGLLFDHTGSYDYSFITGGVLSGLAGISMLVVWRRTYPHFVDGITNKKGDLVI